MALLGPRVGGAHVEVNMDFDDSELDKIGRRIHKQLQNIGGEADQTFNRQFRESIGQMQVAIGRVITLLPLISSGVSALGGSFVALSSAIANASKSALGLIGILGATAIAGATALLGFEGFGAALSAKDAEALAKALENLSPAARDAALAVRGLKDDWKRLRLGIQERMFAGLDDSISRLGETLLPVLSTGLNKMAEALNKLFGSVLDYVNSSDGLELISSILDGSADIFSRLADTAVPFLDGMLRLWDALIPSSQRLADKIGGIADRFQEWANAEGMGKRIDAMMRSAEESASKLWDVAKNLGGAIRDVFGASLPAGNNFLDWLVEITEKFREWTSSAEGQSSIATWAQDGVDAIEKLGEVLGSAGTFFAAISDPKIIQGALDVLQSMFDTLNDLPLEDIASGLGDLLSENGPLIGGILAAGAAMSTFRFLGAGVRAIFGSLATTILNVLAPIRLLTNLIPAGGIMSIFGGAGGAGGAGGGIVGALNGIASAAGTLFRLLPTLLKGAGIAGLAIWIGTTIANSEELRDKLGEIFEKLGEVFGKFGKAVGKIAKSLEPAFEGFMGLIDLLTPVLEFLIGITFDALLIALDGLGTAIEGVGNFISGFIDVITGLFTLDFSKVGEGLSSMFSGFVGLASGTLQILTSLPRVIAETIINAVRALPGIIVTEGPRILTAIGNFILRIGDFVRSLPGRFEQFARDAFVALSVAVVTHGPGILEAIRGFIDDVIEFVGELPGKFLEFGGNAFASLLTAINTGIAIVIDVIKELPGDIVDYFDDLPGDMLEIGEKLIESLIEGIKDAALAIPGVIADVAGGIADAFPGSPVRTGPLTAWNYGGGASGGGRNIIAALAEGLQEISPITDAMNNVAGAIANPMGTGGVNNTSNLTLQVVQYPGEDQVSAGMRALRHSQRIQEEIGSP